MALGAVAPTPLYVREAGEYLAGKPATAEEIEAAARIAQEAARPITDMRGTTAQRKHLSGVLARRALTEAVRARLNGREIIHERQSIGAIAYQRRGCRVPV